MVGNQPGLRRFRRFSIFVMRCIPISVFCALPHLMHAFYPLGSILFAAFDIFDQDHGEKMKKIILNIPLPNSVDNAKYSVENKADFKRPASYIHFKVEDPCERLCGPQPLKLHGFCVLPSPQTARVLCCTIPSNCMEFAFYQYTFSVMKSTTRTCSFCLSCRPPTAVFARM